MSAKEAIQFNPGSIKGAMSETGAIKSDLYKVEREHLHIEDGFNVRIHDAEYKAHIRAIANSIKENGFMQDKPLAGYVAERDGKNVIIITDGHTRLGGYDLAVSEGMDTFPLPVVTKPRGTSMEDLTIALVTSNSGRPLSPFELGQVCKRLVGYGMETKTIAQRLGYGKAYIEGLLDLVAAPKALRDLVTSGKVAATLAVETIKKVGAKDAAKALSEGVKVAESSGKEKVTKKHVKAAVEKKASKKTSKDVAPAKAQKGKQQELPLTAMNNVEVLEKVAAWKAPIAIDADADTLIRSLLCHITGLSDADVQPYVDGIAVEEEM